MTRCPPLKPQMISEVLNRLYPNPPVPLNSLDTFTFLISVVLSAQTTDGKVNEVTNQLFKVASTPYELMNLDPKDVQTIIQPVGLAPTKSQKIVQLSKMIVEKFEGQVPRTFEELESLPGVGHKTASVVMSQSFGHPALAVDTHVHRLALRWGLTKPNEKDVNKVQTDLCNLFPQNEWNRLHLQMIYFGREYCTAKNHVPSECPICSWVNNTDKGAGPPTDFSHFQPQKPAKGIVYYRDRVESLKLNPLLTSPQKRQKNGMETLGSPISPENLYVHMSPSPAAPTAVSTTGTTTTTTEDSSSETVGVGGGEAVVGPRKKRKASISRLSEQPLAAPPRTRTRSQKNSTKSDFSK